MHRGTSSLIYIMETREVERGERITHGEEKERVLLVVFALNWILCNLSCPHSLSIILSTPVGLLNLETISHVRICSSHFLYQYLISVFEI